MKLKLLPSIITMLLFTNIITSQDVITKKTGEDIRSKIIEVTQNEVKFKKFDNIDGPIFSMLKSEILMVRYKNGTKDSKIWNAERMKANSNIIGNLRSRVEFRNGNWQLANIEKVVVEVNNNSLLKPIPEKNIKVI